MPIKESHQTDMEDERLTIDVGNLLAGNHTVEIHYEGRVNDRGFGFFGTTCYSANSKPTQIGGVILERVNARAVFPAFDVNERSVPLNISFELSQQHRTITPMTEATMSARLSQNIQLWFDDILLEQIGWAYYPNDGSVMELRPDGHLVATCRSNLMTLSLSDMIKEIKNYYGFEMRPTQWILLPNLPTRFASAKNLIFIREHLMENSSYTNEMDVMENQLVVTEALASQLFGQTIRAESWSDVWLTKGLAKFTSYKVVEKLYGESEFNRYIIGHILPRILDKESIPHSLSKHAHSKKAVLSMFHQDLYERAGLILRMFEDQVGELTFRRSLSHFINKTISKGVANCFDLWRALEEHSLDFPPGEKVEEVVKSWIYSAGYPVVSVKRENNYLHITQDSMIKDVRHTPDAVGYWWIPITVTSQTIRGPRRFWLRPKATLKVNLPLNDNWYLINEDARGFYRVNYDMENWMSLSEALEKGELGDEVSSRLLDDSFGLAEYNRLSYRIPLQLSKHLSDHLSHKPRDLTWSATTRHLITLRTLLEASPSSKIDEYLSSHIENYILGERVSVDDDSDESSENMTTVEYRVDKNETVIRQMLWKFSTVKQLCLDNQHMKDVIKNMRNVVTDTGLELSREEDVTGCLSNMDRDRDRDSTVEDWLAQYKQYQSPTLENKIIQALSCLPNQQHRLLSMFINSSWGMQREDFVNTITAMSYSEKRVEQILDWMLDNAVQLSAYVSGDIDMLNDIVTALSEKIYTDSTADKFKSVLVGLKQWTDERNQSDMSSDEIHRSLLRIERNRQRRKENTKDILNWFRHPDSRYSFSLASSNTISIFTASSSILLLLNYVLF